MVMWIGIIVGVMLPIAVYIVNFIRFGKKKKVLESQLGVEIQTTWKKHGENLLFFLYPYAVLLQVTLLVLAHWIHPDFEIGTILLTVIQTIFLALPYYGIKGLNCGFFLSEFLTSEQLETWYVDREYTRGHFWYGEDDRLLSNEIKHGDYIPLIQRTVPLIEEKSRYLSMLENLSQRPLTDYEKSVQVTVDERLKVIEEELNNRWHALLIAIGQAERPEVLDKRKETSVREFESLMKQESGAGVAQKQADPALKELYALTQNEEAPEDIKELATKAIQDIENKLETERRNEKEEAIRRSAEAVIQTSRQYHGLEA